MKGSSLVGNLWETGQLVSLRLDVVDLEKTAAANKAGKSVAPPSQKDVGTRYNQAGPQTPLGNQVKLKKGRKEAEKSLASASGTAKAGGEDLPERAEPGTKAEAAKAARDRRPGRAGRIVLARPREEAPGGPGRRRGGAEDRDRRPGPLREDGPAAGRRGDRDVGRRAPAAEGPRRPGEAARRRGEAAPGGAGGGSPEGGRPPGLAPLADHSFGFSSHFSSSTMSPQYWTISAVTATFVLSVDIAIALSASWRFFPVAL